MCVITKSNDINQLVLSLNRNIYIVSKWLSNNHLTLNVAKLITLYITVTENFFQISHMTWKLNQQLLIRVSEVQFLGVVIDDCLKFKSHVVFVTKKNKICYNIYKIQKLSYQNLIWYIYIYIYISRSRIYQKLIYDISVCGSACKTSVEGVFEKNLKNATSESTVQIE